MRAEEEKDEPMLARNDPSKYSLKSHDAHNSLIHNKGRVCVKPAGERSPMVEDNPEEEDEDERKQKDPLS